MYADRVERIEGGALKVKKKQGLLDGTIVKLGNEAFEFKEIFHGHMENHEKDYQLP
jgi:hypothetical protein